MRSYRPEEATSFKFAPSGSTSQIRAKAELNRSTRPLVVLQLMISGSRHPEKLWAIAFAFCKSNKSLEESDNSLISTAM